MHVTALNASSTYRFRVRRGVFGIFSDYTREVKTLPAVSSAAPRDIQIMNTTGGVLSLKWSSPWTMVAQLLHYMVEVCQTFFCRQINSTEPNIILSPMRAYKSYNFRIAAVTAHSVGNFSRWQFLTMGRPYPPGGISTHLYNANCSLVFLSMVALKENEDGVNALVLCLSQARPKNRYANNSGNQGRKWYIECVRIEFFRKW